MPPALVVGVVVGALGGIAPGAGAAAAVWVAVVVVVLRRAPTAALSLVGARRVRDDDVPALANLVEGLSATIGVRRPDLWLVPDEVPNACALGGAGGTAALVVTAGLLDRLGLIELEGVVAHELTHIRRGDAVVSAVALATAGVVARASGADRLVHRAVGAGREYGADRAAVLAVRYPPGLHDALGVMAHGPAPAAGSVFTGGRWAATRWIWIDPMVGALDRCPAGELDATDVRREAMAQW